MFSKQIIYSLKFLKNTYNTQPIISTTEISPTTFKQKSVIIPGSWNQFKKKIFYLCDFITLYKYRGAVS